MSYAASRRNGADFERVAGRYVEAMLSLGTPAGDRSDAAGPLLEALARYPELSVGRNSTVEGVRIDPSGAPVVVECTGSTSVSRTPGCERPCTCRKLLGAAAAVAALCRVEGIDPPGYVVITTALPPAGGSAAGWLEALVWSWQLGDLSSLTFHILDPGTGRARMWTGDDLADRYAKGVVPV